MTATIMVEAEPTRVECHHRRLGRWSTSGHWPSARPNSSESFSSVVRQLTNRVATEPAFLADVGYRLTEWQTATVPSRSTRRRLADLPPL
jgi:hypothetical protein